MKPHRRNLIPPERCGEFERLTHVDFARGGRTAGRILNVALGGILSLAAIAVSGPPAGGAAVSPVVELRIDDVIHPVMAEYVQRGFEEAARINAQLILITMNTPGGLDSSMREIIQRIITSKIPVAVYVTPSGSRAASAGFFILLSADVAAMAPGTDTGAASPVFMFAGRSVELDDTMRRKVTNEAAAYLRSIVGKRGRNVEIAEKAVTEAKAFTEREAMDAKLVDLVAKSPEELLAQLDGRTVTRFDGTGLTLELKNPSRTSVEMTGRQRFLTRILRPDVFFIMLILGVLGLYTEFTHPGLIVPGVIGGISLLLALFAMHLLPVNVTGLLLIGLAIALFLLEAKFTSHGVLGLGGAVAMVLGAMMLIRSPLTGMGVSLSVALGVTLPFAFITVFLMRLVLRSMGWKASVGAEQLVGLEGEVTQAIDGKGMVFVHGELWRAVSSSPIPQGAQVRVAKVDGLTLQVEPVGEGKAATQA